MTVGPGPWCGTVGGYSNHRCRCADCTTAKRLDFARYLSRHPEQVEKQRVRDEARRRAAGMAIRPPRVADDRCPIGYGSRTGYNRHGCRCPYCTDANTAYERGRRARARQAVTS